MIKNRVTLEGIDFHFGLGFLADLSEKTGMDLGQFGEQMIKNPLFIVPKMMMHSANYAIYRDGKDSESYYNIDFFYDKIDELGGATGKFWESFLLAFNDSMTKHVPQQEQTTDKKKVKKIDIVKDVICFAIGEFGTQHKSYRRHHLISVFQVRQLQNK